MNCLRISLNDQESDYELVSRVHVMKLTVFASVKKCPKVRGS